MKDFHIDLHFILYNINNTLNSYHCSILIRYYKLFKIIVYHVFTLLPNGQSAFREIQTAWVFPITADWNPLGGNPPFVSAAGQRRTDPFPGRFFFFFGFGLPPETKKTCVYAYTFAEGFSSTISTVFKHPFCHPAPDPFHRNPRRERHYTFIRYSDVFAS